MNNFSPLMRFLCTKNCCFCCLVFACFYFANYFLLVWCFLCHKKFWLCPDRFIYYTTDIALLTALWRIYISSIFLHALVFIWENLFFFARIFFYLWSPARIYCFLWGSFWTLFICENIFLLMIICQNLFLFMIICENLLEIFLLFQIFVKISKHMNAII